MPAWTSVSRSKPRPVTFLPLNSASSRLKASGFWSITATEWPRSSNDCARVAPTRPQPMMTKCTCRDATGFWERVAGLTWAPVSDIAAAAKRLLLGRPFRTDRLGHTLLPKRIALPVFASDALSSVAYAPDEIILTLSLAGLSAAVFSPWVSLGVLVVLVVVVASYRQNVHAYPSGGGDYEVATTNLGPKAGLTVASALLVDYALTVAVSISSGAQYAASAIPALRDHEVQFALALVAILMVLNLRGIKESGTLFAIPTYVFMAAVGCLVVTGAVRYALGTLPAAESAGQPHQALVVAGLRHDIQAGALRGRQGAQRVPHGTRDDQAPHRSHEDVGGDGEQGAGLLDAAEVEDHQDRDKCEGELHLVVAQGGDRRRRVLRSRGDRHRNGERVVDQQGTGDGQPCLRAQVGGRDLVVATPGRVGVHVLPVGRHHDDTHDQHPDAHPRREHGCAETGEGKGQDDPVRGVRDRRQRVRREHRQGDALREQGVAQPIAAERSTQQQTLGRSGDIRHGSPC